MSPFFLFFSSPFLIAMKYIHYHLSSGGIEDPPPCSASIVFLTYWRPQAAQARWSLLF